MQCPKCGVDLAAGVRFCPECGTKIHELSDVPAPDERSGLKIPSFSVPPMSTIESYGGAASDQESGERPFTPSFKVSESEMIPQEEPLGTDIPVSSTYQAPAGESQNEAKEAGPGDEMPMGTPLRNDSFSPRIEMPPYGGPPPQMQQPPYGAPPPPMTQPPYGTTPPKLIPNAAPKKKAGLIIGISVACVLIIAVAIIFAFMNFGGSSENGGFATIDELLDTYFIAFEADEAEKIGRCFLPELVAAFESDGYSLEEITEYLDAGYDDYGESIKKWEQAVSQNLDIDDTFLGNKNVDIDTSKVQSARYLEADVTFKNGSEIWIFEFDVAKRDGLWYLVEVR